MKRLFLLNMRNYLPNIQQNRIISLLCALSVQIKFELGLHVLATENQALFDLRILLFLSRIFC